MRSIEQDHPRTGAEDRSVEGSDRIPEAVEIRQLRHRRRLSARDHEPVELVELSGKPDLHCINPEPPEHLQVLAERALQSKNADAGSVGSHHPIVTSVTAAGAGASPGRASHAPWTPNRPGTPKFSE